MRFSDDRPVLRLLGVAGSCRDLLPSLGCRCTAELTALVEDALGGVLRVTADASLIEADEDPECGGRFDDDARIAELNGVFGDDRVVAAVALRGGAWLSRLMDRVSFDLLDCRTRPLALVGFSELTPLLNIAASRGNVVAWHDITPGYILSARPGVAVDSRTACGAGSSSSAGGFRGDSLASEGFVAGFKRCFSDLLDMFRGRPSERVVRARWTGEAGAIPETLSVVGGNLSTLLTLLPGPESEVLRPEGRWLLIEDVRESPNRLDRMLSHLSVGGQLGRYSGILVGSFEYKRRSCVDGLLACLRYHLRDSAVTLLLTNDIGHHWPCSPLPLVHRVDVVAEECGVWDEAWRRVSLRPRWSELGVF